MFKPRDDDDAVSLAKALKGIFCVLELHFAVSNDKYEVVVGTWLLSILYPDL